MPTGTKIGDAYIAVDADTTKARSELKGLDSQVQTSSSGLGGLLGPNAPFKGAAIAAGAAVAATAVFNFAKDSVAAASNLGESINAINVVYGESADAVHALGAESATSFGLSQRAFNEFATQFSAFGEKIAAGTGQDVSVVLDNLTTRIADFASVMNLDMAEAATVFQSALAGETEAFRRFGGDVSAAAVEVKALELGLGDTSAELSEQDKILARYELIMEQTAKTAGDFENTSDSLANSQRILTANIEDLQAKIGGALVPAVASATTVFNDFLTITDGIIDALSGDGLIGKLGTVITEASKLAPIIGPVVSLLGGVVDVVGNVADAFRDEATPALVDSKTEHQLHAEQVAANEAALRTQVAAMQEARTDTDAMAASTQSLATQTQIATTALRNQFELIDGRLDVVDNYAQAVQAQADAQANVNQMVADNLEATPEYLEALETLFSANRDVRDAQLQIAETGGITRGEWIKQQVEMGATWAEANTLAEELERIGAFKPPPINFSVTVNGQTYGSLAAVERAIQGVGGQHGRVGFPGQMFPVGEAGPELFIPQVAGRIIPNTSSERIIAALQNGGGGAGMSFGDINVTVMGNATPNTAALIGDEIEDVLRRVAAGRTVR
jgi:hypothetical protein